MDHARARLLSLLLAGVSLLALVGAAGCEDSDPSVSFTPAFAPVTFTLDASGKISISAGKAIVTPIGIFSVDAGVEHQFSVSPKRYLTAVFRYVKPKLGLVEAGYLIRTDRRIEPELDGQSLASAQGGLLRIDATEAEPGEVTRLKISDVPQDTPVPTASASTCRDSGSTEVQLPEVSAGDSVEDTVAGLAAACLNVQYAAEAADGDEGTVSRVVVPTTVPGGEVQLPPVGDGAPGPGDKVTTDERRVATVFVVAPPEEPSPTPTDSSASPTATPPDLATTTVLATGNAPVRTEPSTAGAQVSSVAEGLTYDALCRRHGEEVTAHGRTSDVWIQLRRGTGETGWVTATALDGDPETVVATAC
ncbi:SH3 domain-containing protein [Streptomyces sp. NPDC050619]|uniref:SH3 domain-containing protein n=1 Tax=Streptomyces sp. NPDC050619 TaxID=3157214 RepID=UPI00343899E6